VCVSASHAVDEVVVIFAGTLSFQNLIKAQHDFIIVMLSLLYLGHCDIYLADGTTSMVS